MKKCSKCLIEFDINLFSKNKRSKDGLKPYCKKCASNLNKKYYIDNKDSILEKSSNRRIDNPEYMIEYREKNRASILIKLKEYYSNNKEHILNSLNENYINNKDSILEYKKEYYKDNKEKILEYKKEYYKDNKEKILEYNKGYYKDNSDRIISYNTDKLKERIKYDNFFRFKHRTRGLISNSIRKMGYSKKTKTFIILGCSFEELKEYLESKFEPWMTWDNHGLYNGDFNYGWDIDHKIPISTATTEEEVYQLNHYTNLQPLCSYTNRYIKRNK